jgi:putative hydrolase of the HAD superfamily
VGAGTLWWDFDGTLVSRPFMWSRAAARTLDRLRPGHEHSVETIRAAFAAGMPWHHGNHEHPELDTPDRWWDHVLQRYVAAFLALGCNRRLLTPGLLAGIRAEILDATQYRVFDDVVPVLAQLTQLGWRHLIVSNHVPELESLVVELGLRHHVDAVVTSGLVGYEKPHDRLFDAAGSLTPASDDVWMIGDNVDADCRPVCARGGRAILVRTTGHAYEPFAPDLWKVAEMVTAGPHSRR